MATDTTFIHTVAESVGSNLDETPRVSSAMRPGDSSFTRPDAMLIGTFVS